MKRHLLTIGILILGLAFYMGTSDLNEHFGRRTGEVDQGAWYLIEGRSGARYYQKGIDPSNRYLGAERAQAMVASTPGYVRTDQGFGALWVQRGWWGDGHLSSSGWQLFSTKAEAVAYLQGAGVADNEIYFVYE